MIIISAHAHQDLKERTAVKLSTCNLHYQSRVFRALWRRANIQTVSFRNSPLWLKSIMNSLIKPWPANYFYNTYSDLEYPNIKILPTSSRLPGVIRKVRKDLHFPFTSSLQNNMQCRGYSSTSPWVHSSLFSFLYRFVRTWSSVAFSLNFHFFSVARGELSLLWNCDLSLMFPSFHHMVSLDSSCFEFRFAG